MNIIICKNGAEASEFAAQLFKQEIIKKPECIIGLATGSTPLGMYARLIEMYRNKELSFKYVRSFNLDEYYPISRSDEQSYYNFMMKNLFEHIDISRENINVPNGEVPDAEAECTAYDAAIEAAGGIDIQLLGVGGNGHIGFNEPSDILYAATHKQILTPETIVANSRFFKREEDVPKAALTMGMGSIMKAKKIVIIILGKAKCEAYRQLISGNITTGSPVSMLQMHTDTTVLADIEAADV